MTDTVLVTGGTGCVAAAETILDCARSLIESGRND